jgi:hypothetical protein
MCNLVEQEGDTSNMKLDCLAPADRTNKLSRNVSTELPFYATLNPKRGQISFTRRRTPEITQSHKTLRNE